VNTRKYITSAPLRWRHAVLIYVQLVLRIKHYIIYWETTCHMAIKRLTIKYKFFKYLLSLKTD